MQDKIKNNDMNEQEAGVMETVAFDDEDIKNWVSPSSCEDMEEADEEAERRIAMFGTEESVLRAEEWVAHVPDTICNNPDFFGPIFGIIREETNSIYIFDYKRFEDDEHLIGYVDNGSYFSEKYVEQVDSPFAFTRSYKVVGDNKSGKLELKMHKPARKELSTISEGPPRRRRFFMDDEFEEQPVRIKQYDSVTKLFSRNSGLLESSYMLDKCAVLVGCGSVNSFVAMELARSGVGKFVLCDTDTLEIHNICRHQCGFEDLGRYKVDAVKDKILNINPAAEVVTFRSIIQRVPEDDIMPMLGENTVIIGGGDNRASSAFANKLAVKSGSKFVAIGCWTRAFAGEVFYWRPNRNMACYGCAFGGLIDDERPDSHRTYFGSDDEMKEVSFEPGMYVDIDFVSIIGLKLILDLFNEKNENYTPRVINYLRQYTWICNTNDERVGGKRALMFKRPLQVTNNLVVKKNSECEWCNCEDRI